MNTFNVRPHHFLRHWIISTPGVWLIAGVACLVAWTPFAIVASVLAQYESLEFLAKALTMLALCIIPGMSAGYVIGDMQHNLMRDFLDWTFIDWVKHSTIGGIAGGVLVIVSGLLFTHTLPEHVQWMLALPLFILPLSIVQWRLMRPTTRNTWLWILANVVAAIVFSGLIYSTRPIPFMAMSPVMDVLMWVFATLAQGIVTGVVMLWLYEHPATGHENENPELAPVYIEVRRDDESRKH